MYLFMRLNIGRLGVKEVLPKFLNVHVNLFVVVPLLTIAAQMCEKIISEEMQHLLHN